LIIHILYLFLVGYDILYSTSGLINMQSILLTRLNKREFDFLVQNLWKSCGLRENHYYQGEKLKTHTFTID